MVRLVVSRTWLSVALVGALSLTGITPCVGAEVGLPTNSFGSTRRPPVTIEALLSLVDFGQGDNGAYQPPGFSLSPDGKQVALVTRRADPAQNLFHQTLVVVDRRSKAHPKFYPLNVQPLHQSFPLRGLLTPNGVIAANPPQWSPDGRSIAILAPNRSTTQVLLLALRSGRARFVTDAPGGVMQFGWLANSTGIIFSTRAGLPAFGAAIDREARRGYHYDERIDPLMSIRPEPPSSLRISYRVVSLPDGRERRADPSEGRLVAPDQPLLEPQSVAIEPSGIRASLVRDNPDDPFSSRRLVATLRDKIMGCEAAVCSGHLTNLWATDNGFLFLRREGWGDSETALYRWQPGAMPQRLLATDDLLAGCAVDKNTIICAREGSLQPRRLWSYDTATDRQTILFDPNPDFGRFDLPRVLRLHWAGPLQTQGFGDLIIPDRHPPQAGFPLLVVSYRTRGLKRGAIGDEYPILALAAHGIAVLSVENLPDYASVVGAGKPMSPAAAALLDTTNNNERQLQLGNMLGGLARARSMASIDRDHLGIAGVSDAASSAIFALINTRLFVAASLGSPGLDTNIFALGGPALRRQFAQSGFPVDGTQAQTFYRTNALLPNAAVMKVPLLLQYPQDEYLAGVPTIAAFQDAGAPVDAYFFPGEHHVKSQPAHRLAIYRRNVAWFDFWLRGDDADSAITPGERSRWRSMRTQLCALPRSEGAPIQLCSHASTSTNSVTRE